MSTGSRSEKSAQQKAKEIADAGTRTPREIIQSLTDTGNAERFAQQYSAEVRYVPEWDSWVFWAGDRWRKDAQVFVMQRMQEVAKAIPYEVAYLDDEDDDDKQLRKKILGWATVSLHASKIKAAVEMAKAQEDLIARPGEFDYDPYLLNCRNGTLDLRTGDLRPHDRGDMLTQQTNCDFNPKATSKDWERVLRDAFDGDQDLIAYLRRVFGYSLTGDCSEEKFLLFYGKPGAGKGTILDSFAGTLGDYAANIDANSFKKGNRQNASGPSEDIARLDGIRFALANEFDATDEFAAAKVNMLTGRDKVAARFLNKGTFEFYPQFKIFIAANHLPKQPSSPDSGVWRRIQVVPFDHAVAKIDKDLKTRLGSDEARSAILSWALAGCLEWQGAGLDVPPERVVEAVEEYREDSNAHRIFIEEMLEPSPDNYLPNKVMRDLYQAWGDENGIRHQPSPKALTEILKEQGLRQGKRDVKRNAQRTSVKVWEGVRARGKSDQEQREWEGAGR